MKRLTAQEKLMKRELERARNASGNRIGQLSRENNKNGQWSDFEPVGEFREDSLLDRLRDFGRSIRTKIRRKETPKPYSSEELVKEYEFFREQVYEPRRVFYPCCNLDISPLRGFPNSEVVLMDIGGATENLKKIMRKEGIKEFTLGDVITYNPEKGFDLVIALNPGVQSIDLTRHLVSGGYVMANNWHNNASQLIENPNFEGIGTIDRNANGIYLANRDFSRLEPGQFANYFYVFRKLGASTHKITS